MLAASWRMAPIHESRCYRAYLQSRIGREESREGELIRQHFLNARLDPLPSPIDEALDPLVAIPDETSPTSGLDTPSDE